MIKWIRGLTWLLAVALLCANPIAVAAARPDAQLLDGRVLASVPIAPAETPYKLLVQATIIAGTPYQYVITIANLTPWSIPAASLRDRYLSPDPSVPELTQLWYPGELLPGQAAAVALQYTGGAIRDGCHQIEITLADGLGTILMDCSAAGATTIWEVPLTAEMREYLALPPLTQQTPTGRSKAGVHVARNADPAVMAFIRSAKPAVVAAIDDLDWLREVKQVSPGTTTVGRFMEGDQTFTGDPVVKARQFVAANSARYLENTGVDYWLGWNEPAIASTQDMAWYAAFEAERVRAMAALGLRSAIGNFSTGVPEAEVFAAFMPAAAVAKQYGGILALHEYSAPTLRDGLDARIPGAESIQGAGALTLRYRYWYDHFLRAQDLVIPLVVTEAGIDGGVLRGDDAPKGGWRDFYPAPDGEAAYLEQLSWYDDQLRRDPYVLGFAIFNAGTPGGRWQSFDITGILPQLAGMVNSKG